MEATPEQLLTAREVAAWTGYSLKTLRNWRYEGTGPPWIRLGERGVRYTRRSVQAWLDANSTQMGAS